MGKAILRTGGRKKLPKSSKKRVSKRSIQIAQSEIPQAYEDARKRRLRMAVHYGIMTQDEADEVLKNGLKKKRRKSSPVIITRLDD
jgi:hypothetical protein